MGLGLKLKRSEAVREIQALAWVAQAGVAAGRPGSAWYREAASRADSALLANPSDPAMQAAAALLFDALPGSGEERSRWRQHAAELWQSLAAQFPGNTNLREKLQTVASHGDPPR